VDLRQGKTWYEEPRVTLPRRLDRLKPQQEAIGTAASVVGLIGSAITLIQQIRNAQGRVRGASNALANLSKQLESLERSLSLVREEEALQTAAVGQQVQGITEVAEELQSFLDKLATEQRKRSISQVIHAIKSGDKEDKQLADILDRLDRARDLLVLQISVAQVGVTGNLRDGFRVALGVLMETNKKVNEILGTNLVLAEQLKDRALQQTGTAPRLRF
jgi:chromosome segregation ATPase